MKKLLLLSMIFLACEPSEKQIKFDKMIGIAKNHTNDWLSIERSIAAYEVASTLGSLSDEELADFNSISDLKKQRLLEQKQKEDTQRLKEEQKQKEETRKAQIEKNHNNDINCIIISLKDTSARLINNDILAERSINNALECQARALVAKPNDKMVKQLGHRANQLKKKVDRLILSNKIIEERCGQRPSNAIYEWQAVLQFSGTDSDDIPEIRQCYEPRLVKGSCWHMTCVMRGDNAFGAKVYAKFSFSIRHDHVISFRQLTDN